MKCPICKIRPADSPHHIIPRAQGGSDDFRNEIITCRLCHNELEALAERGIFCTSTTIRLMQLNEQEFAPEINIIEDVSSIIPTKLAMEPIQWIPMEELLANLPKKGYRRRRHPQILKEKKYGKGGRPRIPDGMPMSRYTRWRREAEEQDRLLTAQIMTKGKKEVRL